MSVPNVIGPVETNVGFLIMSIQSNVPYTLLPYPINDNTFGYYWENDLAVINVQITKIPVFTASGSLTNVKISDKTNNGGLAFDTTNSTSNISTIINSSSPQSLAMTQATFANWFLPDIFLARAVYTIKDSNGQIAAITTKSGTTVPATNVIIQPVNWYFPGCGSCCDNINGGPFNSIFNWFCNVSPSALQCIAYTPNPTTYTELDDCLTGFGYQYCPVNKTCGTDNCNGPCSTDADICVNTDNAFACEVDTSRSTWWKNPIFISVVIIGTIGLIIFAGIIIILLVKRSKKSTEETEEETE